MIPSLLSSRHSSVVALRPTTHLKALDDSGLWEAVGNDPAFQCLGPEFPLPAGWYAFEIELESVAGAEMWSYLYPDYGNPDLESDKVFMPIERSATGLCSGIVLFKQQVRSLRFDPAVSVCRFRVGAFKIGKVDKRTAGEAMLGALLRRDVSWAHKCLTFSRMVWGVLRGGGREFARRLYDAYAQRPEGSARVPYQTWIDLYDAASPERTRAESEEAATLADGPLLSIILPVYNTPEKWLRKCVASVQRQAYGHWELCIANDASTAPHVRRVLDDMARRDPRIKVVHRPTNGHISASSNSAIALAAGEWFVLLDHDDELHRSALLEVAKAIRAHPRWRLIYSDEDKIDERDERFDPYMKPDWNYDLFLSHNCISHLGVYHAEMVRQVGGFLEGMEGSQDWDLALRCIETLDDDQIGHIPKVLYHWRAIAGSTALAPQEKDYAHLAGLRTLAAHLDRVGSSGRVREIPGQRGNYRVSYLVPQSAPLVSIVIPTRDRLSLLKACVDSVLETTRYGNYEIVIADNQSVEPETLAYFHSLDGRRVRVVSFDAPFNYSAINNFAVAKSKGSVICLLNNDITVITPEWLEEMVGHALRPGIGAVGAMLYYPNDTIQHAGVIVGAHGIAAHAYSGYGRGHPGHMSRARLTQSLTAVTAACLVVTREAFESVQGFDPALQVAFNDVDFCLRLREKGYRNVWTPFAELYHHESASRGYEDSPEKVARFNSEIRYMRDRWGSVLDHDPAYSPNHSITDELHLLAFPPRH